MPLLKPEISLPVALATGAMVYGIYQVALPTIADARSIEADNEDLRQSENTALWIAVAISAGVALVAEDPTPFWFGGGVAVALSWWHRHARNIDPNTGRLNAVQNGNSVRAPVDLRNTFSAAPA